MLDHCKPTFSLLADRVYRKPPFEVRSLTRLTDRVPRRPMRSDKAHAQQKPAEGLLPPLKGLQIVVHRFLKLQPEDFSGNRRFMYFYAEADQKFRS